LATRPVYCLTAVRILSHPASSVNTPTAYARARMQLMFGRRFTRQAFRGSPVLAFPPFP